ncbi:MAG: hypothetical protein ACEQSB_00230 [Undibacterium sp.]
MIRPKFPECVECIYFLKKFTNPVCKECDAGEFFTEKFKSTEMSDDDLMREFGEREDE